jgi:hypothetical protein
VGDLVGTVYDELYISIMREMDVCASAIRKLERVIWDMERKYHLKTSEFIEHFNKGGMEDNSDFVTWHASYVRLKHWEGRLKEFKDILRNAQDESVR